MKSPRLDEPLDALDFVRETGRNVIQASCSLRVARIEDKEADMHDEHLSPAQKLRTVLSSRRVSSMIDLLSIT